MSMIGSADITIRADGLVRRFGKLLAVDGVSFAIPRGAIFGFLGPNGSGKSTVIRMLCGVLSPTAGRGEVLGIDVAREPERVKRHIGYMSQKFSLYSDLTVRENLDFYGRVYGLSRARLADRKQSLLDMVRMHDRLDQLAGTLSGGWKQRLALACALIHEPSVLFLDEPTAGIDPVARRDLWDLLFELSTRGVTLLVTTHYMDEAERCTHVGYIHQGKMGVFGRPEELKRLPHVTPPGTRRIEMTTISPAAALKRLKALPGVRDATLFGESVHLLVDQSLSDSSLRHEVTELDRDAKLRPMTPSLEDVFVSLSRGLAAPADFAKAGAA